MSVQIGKIDVIRDEDNYHRGSLTYTELWLSPEERRLVVSQQERTGSTPIREWHGLELTMCIDSTQFNTEPPDGDELEAFLKSEEGQEILDRVVAGHDTGFDGNNWSGWLRDNGKAAWDELEREIDNLPRSPIHSLFVEEWLESTTDKDLGLTLTMTNEELEKAAEEIIEQADLNDVYLLGDVKGYLEKRLEEMKENASNE